MAINNQFLLFLACMFRLNFNMRNALVKLRKHIKRVYLVGIEWAHSFYINYYILYIVLNILSLSLIQFFYQIFLFLRKIHLLFKTYQIAKSQYLLGINTQKELFKRQHISTFQL